MENDEVKFDSSDAKHERTIGATSSGYFLVLNEQGAMHCSCGRELEKLDDNSYMCKGGFPIYRPDKGEVIKDKFGNIMLKVLPH